MSTLDIRNLEVRFGDEVVIDGIDLGIRDGELVTLLGPSGCGKSTMLRILGGLADHHGGSVTVDGRPAAQSWDRLAYVFQAARLAPWRTALDNVVLGMKLRGVEGSRREIRERARGFLETVGIGALADRPAHALSGGEQQRVSIARALSVEPSVLMMDEPFSALDVQTRRRLRQEIVSLWERTALTIVLVTHDIEEALVVGSRVVVCSPKPTGILADIDVDMPYPRDPATAEFGEHRKRIAALFGSDEAAGGRTVTDVR
ncbi:ABC transporter ATP-binding protein [Actinomadura bangladeshensis]|uniref:ABC transporter ATP-binding protein n=1 Tax=Actinomadura bangladeshensis TaxID=453573 RepID=UPI0014054BDB|nr:ABC transporter ATP-binding protein [Actinomadura bangladeshensis]